MEMGAMGTMGMGIRRGLGELGPFLFVFRRRAPVFGIQGEGGALQRRRPSAKQQFARLRALNLEDDETGEIVEVYWADRLELELDGRSMVDPWATWRDSDARFLQLERLRRKSEVLSAL